MCEFFAACRGIYNIVVGCVADVCVSCMESLVMQKVAPKEQIALRSQQIPHHVGCYHVRHPVVLMITERHAVIGI